METLFEALGNGIGNGIGWLAEHGVLFLIFAVLWAAFAVGIVWSHDQAWQAIRDLPLLVQIVLWVLLLPVMVGMWIWESGWPFLVRVALVLSLAGWNLFMFLPRAIQTAKP